MMARPPKCFGILPKHQYHQSFSHQMIRVRLPKRQKIILDHTFCMIFSSIMPYDHISHQAKFIFWQSRAFGNDFDNNEILKWLKVFYARFFSQQFKRSCMPDGIKVGTISCRHVVTGECQAMLRLQFGLKNWRVYKWQEKSKKRN
jgi:hypothetical protein